jgi:hypothetical protein
MSDYLADLAALDTYGCAPMSVADLMEEFEVFPILVEEEGLVSI